MRGSTKEILSFYIHFNQHSHAVLSMVEIIGTKCCRTLEGNQMVSTLGFDAICHKSNVWYAVQKHCRRLPPSISSFDHWCLLYNCHYYNDSTCTGRQSWKTQIFGRRSCRNQTMIFEHLFILFHQLYNKSLPLTQFDTHKKASKILFKSVSKIPIIMGKRTWSYKEIKACSL